MPSLSFKIALGSEVKDKVTGYRGIVTGCTQWLNGCNRYQVQAPMNKKDGKIPEIQGFDEDNLEIIKDAAVSHREPKTGGVDQGTVTRGSQEPRRT